MDPECARLLPALCALLADPRRPVTDDTCLEKLLDWFQALAAAGPSLQLLQEHPCLLELLRGAAKGPEPSTPVLAFALRLAGIFASQENCFQFLQVELLPGLFGKQGARSPEAWAAPAVRSAWIQGLSSLAQHSSALSFLADLGVVDSLLILQGDTSLFVATAAGRLLAQVLGLSLRDRPCPAAPWPPPACEVLAHLEEALRPASTPQSTVQLIRALGVLTTAFSDHGPWTQALWGWLSPAVTRLLDEPLTHAHMLGDLLLAVARCPAASSEPPWEPLARVLGLLEPPRAGQLALDVLQLQEGPRALRAQALDVLLRPLAPVLAATAVPGLRDLPVGTPGHPVSEDTLPTSRPACAGLLCQSLACLTLLRPLRPSPWPQAFVLGSVLAVLRICGGSVAPTSDEGCRLCATLAGCERLQRAALDLLGALAPDAGCPELLAQVCAVLLELLDSPDSSPLVLQKTLQASVAWLPSAIKTSDLDGLHSPAQLFLPELLLVLQKLLCSPSWEVRDSGLEFLTQAASLCAGQADFRRALLASSVLALTEQLLRDPESYVRASAVTAVGQLSGQGLWALPGGQQDCPSEALLGVLAKDPEGLPRGAVLRVLTAWLRTGHAALEAHPEPLLARALQAAGRDPDWEVRAQGVELARAFLGPALGPPGAPCPYAPVPPAAPPPHPSPALRPTCLFEFLFCALFDADRPVARGACQLLLTIRDCAAALDLDPPDTRDALDTATLEAALCCWQAGEPGRPLGELAPRTVLAVLRALDLDGLRLALAESGDHAEGRPLSLLQDVLASAGARAHNQADCY